MEQPKYYIGTAGWSYKDWIPAFYPKAQSGNFDWLSYYARYFNCVEVNASYYTYLSPRIAEGWIKKTEDIPDFLFTIKLHQDFTHKRTFDKQKTIAVRTVLDILSRANRFGGLLIQFPYSFSFNSSAMQYITQLSVLFENYNKIVEVRHGTWNKQEVVDGFKKLEIIFCTVDQPQMVNTIPFDLKIINGKAYIRFHGRNTEAWKKSINTFNKAQSYAEQSERYNYLYSPGELVEFKQVIKERLDLIKEIYIIFNNHPKGNAVCNAFELMFILKPHEEIISIPPNTLLTYPRLKKY
jgi:uncharacterized protein YecE (DUF72 family)